MICLVFSCWPFSKCCDFIYFLGISNSVTFWVLFYFIFNMCLCAWCACSQVCGQSGLCWASSTITFYIFHPGRCLICIKLLKIYTLELISLLHGSTASAFWVWKYKLSGLEGPFNIYVGSGNWALVFISSWQVLYAPCACVEGSEGKQVQVPGEGSKFGNLWSQSCGELWPTQCGFWDWNSGLLEGKYVLLIVETSLHTFKRNFILLF